MTTEQKIFSYCPQCGKENREDTHVFQCTACGFVHYFSPKPGTKGIIRTPSGKIVLTRRNIAPYLGTLDLVGGFLEKGETFEEGLLREAEEELGVSLPIRNMTYLGSFAKPYEFRNITYHVIVPLFLVDLAEEIDTTLFDKEEIQEVLLMSPKDIHMEDIGPEDYKVLLLEYLKKYL